jgi:hypothetical protein
MNPDGVYDMQENSYTTGCGTKLYRIHGVDLCVGRPCTIHNPSDHHMRSFPTHWRDGGIFDIKPPHMERICPHGVGHPDPDGVAKGVDVHGCDGCCQ